jgi:magnesium chelatase family protein
VAGAWRGQRQRQGVANGELTGQVDDNAGLSRRMQTTLAQRARRFGLSPRRIHRASRVARTIADLEGSRTISQLHVDEALAYRPEPRT